MQLDCVFDVQSNQNEQIFSMNAFYRHTLTLFLHSWHTEINKISKIFHVLKIIST